MFPMNPGGALKSIRAKIAFPASSAVTTAAACVSVWDNAVVAGEFEKIQDNVIENLSYLNQGFIVDFKIPNPKHQITNKSQIPIINDQNGHRELNWPLAENRLISRVDSMPSGSFIFRHTFSENLIEGAI